jgi:hypoxanthine-DNA glycosylase
MSEALNIKHPIEPVYNASSRVLILGSFPSVKSREQKFFYGHKQNRFWKVLAQLIGTETPGTIEEKRDFLLRNHIAVWDVIASCTIEGSSDSSIRDVVPNDLTRILEAARIQKIFVNGGKAAELYKRYIYPQNGVEAIKLPSTSPANAAFSLDRLIREWKIVADTLSN